jgi:hypothetical protein
MKHTFKPRLLKRSVMAMLGVKKPLTTFDRRPDDYYKHVYLDKPFFKVIDFLAETDRMSKKKMTHVLLELGIGYYMGEKIREYNQRAIAARQLEQEPELTRFIILLRRWAKERGMDISKFI